MGKESILPIFIMGVIYDFFLVYSTRILAFRYGFDVSICVCRRTNNNGCRLASAGQFYCSCFASFHREVGVSPT